jgi:hypothetical protein
MFGGLTLGGTALAVGDVRRAFTARKINLPIECLPTPCSNIA